MTAIVGRTSGRQRGDAVSTILHGHGARPDINVSEPGADFCYLGSYSRSNATSNSVEHRPRVSDFGPLEATAWVQARVPRHDQYIHSG